MRRFLVTMALSVAFLAPSTPVEAALVQSGRTRLGLGFSFGPGSGTLGLSGAYVVDPLLVPGAALTGTLDADGPNTASSQISLTTYPLSRGVVTPFADVNGGRLFVGSGFEDAWFAGAGAGALVTMGSRLGLTVGYGLTRYFFDSGVTVDQTGPIFAFGVFL